jgi:lysophospholipase L1-like esterase
MRTPAAGDAPDLDLTAPLSTDQDVLRRVDWLVDQHSRRNRTLWLLFLSSNGVTLPVVVPIDGVPERPDPQFVGNMCFVIADVLARQAPGGTAVVVLTRPGSESVDDTDRYWFRTIRDAAREHGASIRMLCLATPASVRQLTVRDAG